MFDLTLFFPASADGGAGETGGDEDGYCDGGNDLAPFSARGRCRSGGVEENFDGLPLVHPLAPEEGVSWCESGVNEVTDLSRRVGAALVAVDVDEVDLLLDHRIVRVAGVARCSGMRGACSIIFTRPSGGGVRWEGYEE